MGNFAFDVINDIMVSLSRENDFTRDGLNKVSGSLLFDKYSVLFAILIDVAYAAKVLIRRNFDSSISIWFVVATILVPVVSCINYIFRGRFFRTIYYKDDTILIMDGYNHTIRNLSIDSIVDFDGYDGFRGMFRYMYFRIHGEKRRVYFNPSKDYEHFAKYITQRINSFKKVL
jgi:hypothetical protein